MLTRYNSMLAAAALVLCFSQCSNDANNEDEPDAKVSADLAEADAGPETSPPDIKTPEPDLQPDSLVQKDAGETGTDCWAILLCIDACAADDISCEMGCFSEGTTTAQLKYQAWNDCLGAAEQGPCKEKCAADPGGDPCHDCLQATCVKETDTCLIDGPLLAGFGDPCNALNPQPCGDDLECFIYAQGKPEGMCSHECTDVGNVCPGTPEGTFAACILPSSNNKYVCAFVCKLGAKDYACPAEQECSTEPLSPGDDNYACLPTSL